MMLFFVLCTLYLAQTDPEEENERKCYSLTFPADFPQSMRFHTQRSFIKTEWCHWTGFGLKGALAL